MGRRHNFSAILGSAAAAPLARSRLQDYVSGQFFPGCFNFSPECVLFPRKASFLGCSLSGEWYGFAVWTLPWARVSAVGEPFPWTPRLGYVVGLGSFSWGLPLSDATNFSCAMTEPRGGDPTLVACVTFGCGGVSSPLGHDPAGRLCLRDSVCVRGWGEGGCPADT